MMFWYGHGTGAWLAMTIAMIAFWVLVIAALVWLIHTIANPTHQGGDGNPWPGPQQLLAERLARGEIDEAEYRNRLAILQRGNDTSAQR